MAASSSEQVENIQKSPFKELGFPDDFISILSQNLRMHIKQNASKSPLLKMIMDFDRGVLPQAEILDYMKKMAGSFDQTYNELKKLFYRVFDNVPETSRFRDIQNDMHRLNILDPKNAHKVDHDYFSEEDRDMFKQNIAIFINHFILKYGFFFMLLNPEYRDHIASTDSSTDFQNEGHLLSIVHEENLRIYSNPLDLKQEMGVVSFESGIYSPTMLFLGKKLYFTWEANVGHREAAKSEDRISIMLVKMPSVKHRDYRMSRISKQFRVLKKSGESNFREDIQDFTGDLRNLEVMEAKTSFVLRMNEFKTQSTGLFEPYMIDYGDKRNKFVFESHNSEWFRARRLSLFYLLSHLVERWRFFQETEQKKRNLTKPRRVHRKSIPHRQTKTIESLFGRKITFTTALANELISHLRRIFQAEVIVGERVVDFKSFFLDVYEKETDVLEVIDQDFETVVHTQRTRNFFRQESDDLYYLFVESDDLAAFSLGFMTDIYNKYREIMNHLKDDVFGFANIHYYIESNDLYDNYEDRLFYLNLKALDFSVRALNNRGIADFYSNISGLMVKRTYLLILYLIDLLRRFVDRPESHGTRFSIRSIYDNRFPKRQLKIKKSACRKCS